MNQKRFITLLPIIFFIIVLAFLVYAYFYYNQSNYGCIGNKSFVDDALDIEVKVPCFWEVNSHGKNYRYKFTNGNNVVTIVNVTSQTRPGVGDLYKDLGNNLIRFRAQDDERYYYYVKGATNIKFQIYLDTNSENFGSIDNVIKNIYQQL